MRNIKRYLKIYAIQIRLALKILFLFRLNTIGLVLSTSMWSILILSTVFITTQRVRTVFGYTPQELLALAAVQVIFLGVFHTMISKNMERIPELINKGTFDFILLKPIDSQFYTTLGHVFPATLARIFIGIGVLVYLNQIGSILIPSIWSVLAFMGTLLCGVVIVYCVWFMVSTLLIWLPQMDNIVDLLYYLNTSSRYPYEFYREIGVMALLVLFPFSVALTVPTKVLMGTNTLFEVIILLGTTVLLFAISRMFWKFALKHYTSASA